MTISRQLAILAAALALVPAAAFAQTRLPIEQGVYVESGQPCNTGDIWFYSSGRIGDLSFYGPNQSMGPDFSGVEAIESAESARDGFTRINGGPVEVRTAGQGQILLRTYSIANGELNRERMRLCTVSSLHPRMQAALRQLGYRENSATGEGASGQSAASAGAAWRMARGPSGVLIARVAAASGLPELSVRCRGDVAYLYLRTSTAERGRGPRQIEFVGGTTGQRRSETFNRDPETGDWSSGAGSETLALLAGRDTQVDMRENGRSIGTLSLVGSTAALGQALAGCPAQGVSGGLAASPADGARTVPPLGILPGYYVTEERACGNPFDIFFFDGRRFGYYVERNIFNQVWPVRSAERGRDAVGRDGWILRGASPEAEVHVRVLAPNRVHLVSGPPMRWCPDNQLPRNSRVVD